MLYFKDYSNKESVTIRLFGLEETIELNSGTWDGKSYYTFRVQEHQHLLYMYYAWMYVHNIQADTDNNSDKVLNRIVWNSRHRNTLEERWRAEQIFVEILEDYKPLFEKEGWNYIQFKKWGLKILKTKTPKDAMESFKEKIGTEAWWLTSKLLREFDDRLFNSFYKTIMGQEEWEETGKWITKYLVSTHGDLIDPSQPNWQVSKLEKEPSPEELDKNRLKLKDRGELFVWKVGSSTHRHISLAVKHSNGKYETIIWLPGGIQRHTPISKQDYNNLLARKKKSSHLSLQGPVVQYKIWEGADSGIRIHKYSTTKTEIIYKYTPDWASKLEPNTIRIGDHETNDLPMGMLVSMACSH